MAHNLSIQDDNAAVSIQQSFIWCCLTLYNECMNVHIYIHTHKHIYIYIVKEHIIDYCILHQHYTMYVYIYITAFVYHLKVSVPQTFLVATHL